MNQIAIIGPTASGKSALAIELALTCNASIFSIDSLSIYREIDIASAKPSALERQGVVHYGIDLLSPDEPFNVTTLFDYYLASLEACRSQGKNLILVGGSSFYLKSMLTGLSSLPPITQETRLHAQMMLRDLSQAYDLLYRIDPRYMSSITPSDRYRIEKMLLLYLQSGMTPTEWFALHPSRPVADPMPIFNLAIEREVLRSRIKLRTEMMFQNGLIDEVCRLESRYGRAPQSMQAIGIVEVFDYLDGLTCIEQTIHSVFTHTAQLAKRQETFNAHQFEQTFKASGTQIFEEAKRALLRDD
ncbi:MAG: tRNA (adenosine(37)-N6)-dimethylallyltransferase MiaA [Campylobacterales bacterium]|nr:tRNA (adenosine(37)-N6)-dimethylallyltransferase MiaA [Campylobacterales bacterium]